VSLNKNFKTHQLRPHLFGKLQHAMLHTLSHIKIEYGIPAGYDIQSPRGSGAPQQKQNAAGKINNKDLSPVKSSGFYFSVGHKKKLLYTPRIAPN
jgi:hypothetical protein